jgi:periplasmic protein TonB
MFEQELLQGGAGTRRAWTVAVSFSGQLLAVGVAVLVPLVMTDKLPSARLVPYRMEAPPARQPRVDTRRSVRVVNVVRGPRTVFAPVAWLSRPQTVVDRTLLAPPDPAEFRDGVPGGDPAAQANPVVSSLLRTAAPEAPAPKESVPARSTIPGQIPVRVRVGGLVQAARLLAQAQPRYPVLAIQTRTSGTVLLAAVIGRDGRIRELRLVSGHPLLAPAAIEAVRQWVYRPTLLNGDPVEVATEIAVTFNLSSRR